MLKKIRKKIKKHFIEVIKIKKSPHSMALGFAIGTFIAIFPTWGLTFLLGLIVIALFPKVNKFTLLLAFIIWNPLITAPLYLWAYKLGTLIFGSTPIVKFNIIILDQFYNFSRRFIVGISIISLIISIISYFIVKLIAQAYKNKKRKNLK
ncbi:MAG: DUF2062 domain-containing protein [Nanoarchaeota archaeon]|nr:DUF2062 domain-containing protein [Nanoarchaeota archaeon]